MNFQGTEGDPPPPTGRNGRFVDVDNRYTRNRPRKKHVADLLHHFGRKTGAPPTGSPRGNASGIFVFAASNGTLQVILGLGQCSLYGGRGRLSGRNHSSRYHGCVKGGYLDFLCSKKSLEDELAIGAPQQDLVHEYVIPK